jgi:glutamyl-Q tRNA(Asp) synthetase
MPYVGRFAPSPTGALHLGTLAAAVTSYIHARQAGGRWLVRIEDIDPPREVAGAADSILRTLETLELGWDQEVRFQGGRSATYLSAGEVLYRQGAAYYCRCSRQQLRAQDLGHRYPGTCRDLNLGPSEGALRLRLDADCVRFDDGLQGPVERDVLELDGDFVIVRRDGLPAYHLAVVIDDADQGVTDIVRGIDLLDSTPLHIALQRRLGLPTPRYWHIPLITNRSGEKLSKGSGAAALDTHQPALTASRILTLLGLPPPAELSGARPRELWAFAVEQFRFAQLGGQPVTIAADDP